MKVKISFPNGGHYREVPLYAQCTFKSIHLSACMCPRTLFLVRVCLLDSDEFGQHTAEPLRIDEVEIIEKTAVLIVKEDAIVMEEANCLVNVCLLDLS